VMVTNAIGPIVGTMAIITVSGLLTIIQLDAFAWFQRHLFTTHFILWQYAFHDPIPWDQVMDSLIHLGAYSAAFVAVAFVLFKRKDVLT